MKTPSRKSKNSSSPSRTLCNDCKFLVVFLFCMALGIASVLKVSVLTSSVSTFTSIGSHSVYQVVRDSLGNAVLGNDGGTDEYEAHDQRKDRHERNTTHSDNDSHDTARDHDQDMEDTDIPQRNEYYGIANEKNHDEQETDHNRNNNYTLCEKLDPTRMLLRNKIVSQNKNVQDDNRKIPRTIHFIVRSRCVPRELAKQYWDVWEAKLSKDFSILYHDQTFLDEYMARERRDWPSVAAAYKCALDPIARMDLAKLMLLWDHGGMVVDMGYIPGSLLDDGRIIREEDECVFETNRDGTTNPRFIACQAGHSALFASILRFMSPNFVDYSPWFPYNAEKRSDIIGFVSNFMEAGEDTGEMSLVLQHKMGQMNGTITQINTTRTDNGGELLMGMNVSNETWKEIELDIIPFSEQNKCINRAALKNDSYKVDIESLLELVDYGKENSTCTKPPNYIGSNYVEGSIVPGRKIPKIVHMTSRFRCFTGNYTLSINKWKFEGYSLFMHDDVAVERLLSREWPEFPLLQTARLCIATGAGMADLWRYLVLWEYGGIYTDIDNEPGPKFKNGTIITDDMDSFFEQEGGGFPSQYFFAASPHHPVMYHAVQHAISRLFEVQNIAEQLVPFVTGPGALKCGVKSTINDGYPSRGTYRDPSTNRTITIVGSRREAMNHLYLRRSVVLNKKIDFVKMGMRHYSKEANLMTEQKIKMNTCLSEIYSKSFMATHGK